MVRNLDDVAHCHSRYSLGAAMNRRATIFKSGVLAEPHAYTVIRGEDMLADMLSLTEAIDFVVADAITQTVRGLRCEMAIEFDDERLGYVCIQINRDAWERLNERGDH